jgi:hypothetical protein
MAEMKAVLSDDLMVEWMVDLKVDKLVDYLVMLKDVKMVA